MEKSIDGGCAKSMNMGDARKRKHDAAEIAAERELTAQPPAIGVTTVPLAKSCTAHPEPVPEDIVLERFQYQKTVLMHFLSEARLVRIGTLGPRGTTSYEALKYFLDYLRAQNETNSHEVGLWNTFEQVFDKLLRNEVDLIVVPNAYESITDMYWNPEVHNLFSFLFETPAYGLAVRDGRSRTPGKKASVAVCKPVMCLLDKLGRDILGKHGEYEVVRAYSTAESVELVLNGRVEYALTNETSIQGTDMRFVSAICKANVLWTVFCSKSRVASWINRPAGVNIQA